MNLPALAPLERRPTWSPVVGRRSSGAILGGSSAQCTALGGWSLQRSLPPEKARLGPRPTNFHSGLGRFGGANPFASLVLQRSAFRLRFHPSPPSLAAGVLSRHTVTNVDYQQLTKLQPVTLADTTRHHPVTFPRTPKDLSLHPLAGSPAFSKKRMACLSRGVKLWFCPICVPV
jgi:hypothetical protein